MKRIIPMEFQSNLPISERLIAWGESGYDQPTSAISDYESIYCGYVFRVMFEQTQNLRIVSNM